MRSIVMFIGFTHTKIRNNSNILSHSNLFCLFFLGWRGRGRGRITTPSPILLENRNPYSLLKVGEDPAMLNEDHLIQFLVTTNKAITIGFKFENRTFTRFRKKDKWQNMLLMLLELMIN